MVTVGDIKHKIKEELKFNYQPNEISTLSKALFEHLLKYSSTDFLLNNNKTVSQDIVNQFNEAITRLKTQEPIAYITESCNFYGLSFNVNKKVLIPRPETEELIELIKSENENPATILDICTGSGCIAISLKSLYKNSEVDGWDISTDALTVAKSNSLLNHLDVNYIKIDVLNHIPEEKTTFDIIVSNPPYVTESEKQLMHTNVIDFEPHIALFVDDNDPLIFYRKIVRLAEIMLNPKGKLYLEINEAFGQETLNLFDRNIFSKCYINQDINGKDRMISAQRK